jgi:hypothetical protein
MQTKLHDVEMNLRGILRGFGLKVGATTPHTVEGRVRDLVSGHATLWSWPRRCWRALGPGQGVSRLGEARAGDGEDR